MQPLRIVCLSACLTGLAATPLAHAEEGEFQLGLATPFLGYSSITVEPDGGSETTVSGMTWGIGHEVIAELGYGVTPNLVVGGLVELRGKSSTTEVEDVDEEVEESEFGFMLAPKLDYVFLPGDKVQPFIGGVIGYFNSSEEGETSEVTTSGFAFMARGGLRLFPGKEFSIDPWLGLSYLTGSAEQDIDGVDETFEADISGYEIMVHVTLSGWID